MALPLMGVMQCGCSMDYSLLNYCSECSSRVRMEVDSDIMGVPSGKGSSKDLSESKKL